MKETNLRVNDYIRTPDGSASKIRFFMKLEACSFTGGVKLQTCHPGDPDLCAIEIDSEKRETLRPWEVEWVARSSSSTAEKQEKYEEFLIDNNLLGMGVSYREWPPLSNHQRLKVMTWLQETEARIQEYLDNPDGRVKRIKLLL